MEGLSIFDSDLPGPITLIIGLMHGNEPIGFRFLDALNNAKKANKIHGKILFLIGNPEAAELNSRFIDRDLNRSFGLDFLGDKESRRAMEIKQFLSDYGTINFAFDIHSTPTRSDPMIICLDNNISLQMAKVFSINRVLLNLDKILEGISIGRWLSEELHISSLAFECGQHGDLDTIKIADSLFLTILSLQNGDALVVNKNQEIIYATEALRTSSKEFCFRRDFRGFEKISSGEIIAIEPGKSVSFSKEKIMLIPRPDALNELDSGKAEVIVGYLGELWENC